MRSRSRNSHTAAGKVVPEQEIGSAEPEPRRKLASSVIQEAARDIVPALWQMHWRRTQKSLGVGER